MMTRKQFLGSLAAFGGLFAIGACSKQEDPENTSPMADASIERQDAGTKPIDAAKPIDAPPAMACTTTSSTIASNHGHMLVVPQADVTAGVEKSYNIQGGSSHPHMVTITAAMFAMLKTNRTLSVTSTVDASHSHAVTVTC